MHDEPPRPAVSPHIPELPSAPRQIASGELFGGAREIVIEHGGRLYRLRITQNDKLILTA